MATVKVVKEVITYSLELSKEEYDALFNFIGKSTHTIRVAGGVSDKDSNLVTKIYQDVNDIKPAVKSTGL